MIIVEHEEDDKETVSELLDVYCFKKKEDDGNGED